MPSSLFNELNTPQFDTNGFINSLNELKSKGGDPNTMIQGMLNSGRITQSQLNSAVNKAQNIMKMLWQGVRLF